MQDQLISFETAKLVRKLNAKIGASNFYDKETKKLEHATADNYIGYDQNKYIGAPTQSLLQRWLREKHNMLVATYANACGYLWQRMDDKGGTFRAYSEYTGDCPDSGSFTTYEKALEAGLQEALKQI